MIVYEEHHPGIKLLSECRYPVHLIGSRFVGPHDPRTADYDFLIVADDFHSSGLMKWLMDNGFESDPKTYGTDGRMLSSHVWSREWEGHPKIDLLPVTPEEADHRLTFLRSMRAIGHDKGGRLSLALKKGEAWALIWEALANRADG